jgi:hypothetical protein
MIRSRPRAMSGAASSEASTSCRTKTPAIGLGRGVMTGATPINSSGDQRSSPRRRHSLPSTLAFTAFAHLAKKAASGGAPAAGRANHGQGSDGTRALRGPAHSSPCRLANLEPGNPRERLPGWLRGKTPFGQGGNSPAGRSAETHPNRACTKAMMRCMASGATLEDGLRMKPSASPS